MTDAEALAHKAAYDVALYDQQGCLSPQLIYVEEGGAVTPKEFAALLATSLAHWQTELPRGPVPPEVSTTIRRVRGRSRNGKRWPRERRGPAREPERNGLDSGVRCRPDLRPIPSISDDSGEAHYETLRSLAGFFMRGGPYLEAVGVAADSAQIAILADTLGASGVNRVCSNWDHAASATELASWRKGRELVIWCGGLGLRSNWRNRMSS